MMDDGFWRDAVGDPAPRTCGSCLHCSMSAEGGRYPALSDVAWWLRADPALHDRFNEMAGICCQEGEEPVPVLIALSGEEMPCGGEGYERRYA